MREVVIPIYVKMKVGKTHIKGKQMVASISAKVKPGFLPVAYLLIGFHCFVAAVKALLHIE
jgi:hypothetical protein